ncbi:ferrous iron transport protein A [Ruminococcaceae bacterium OttesenSCG-928-I18]|nr:ferrous iron transport protein A [Ruminococcaceae bacterium OttesenSCG-928-I18]
MAEKGARAHKKHPVNVGALPLCSAVGRESMCVAAVHGHAEERGFLKSLGFVPGAHVRVVSAMGKNLIVEIKGTRIALDGHLAHHILVQPQ